LCPSGYEIICRKCGHPLEAHVLSCPSGDSLSLDYIAGFFDGEGSAILSVKKAKNTWCGVHFVPRIEFFQKTPEILEKIACSIGVAPKGFKLRHRLTGSKGAYGECYRLEISKIEDVNRIAKILAPRCHLKKQQLELLIEATELIMKTGFPQRRGYKSKIPKETIKRLIDIAEKIRKLNGRKFKRYTDLETLRMVIEGSSY